MTKSITGVISGFKTVFYIFIKLLYAKRRKEKNHKWFC